MGALFYSVQYADYRNAYLIVNIKFTTRQWLMVAISLTVIWVGLMAGLSYMYLLEKDPVRLERWTSDHSPE